MTVDVGPRSLRLIVSVGHHNVQGISPSRRVRHGGVSHPFAVRDFPPQDGDLATSKSSLVWAEILPRCGNHNRTLSSPVRLCVPCAANQQNRSQEAGGMVRHDCRWRKGHGQTAHPWTIGPEGYPREHSPGHMHTSTAWQCIDQGWDSASPHEDISPGQCRARLIQAFRLWPRSGPTRNRATHPLNRARTGDPRDTPQSQSAPPGPPILGQPKERPACAEHAPWVP